MTFMDWMPSLVTGLLLWGAVLIRTYSKSKIEKTIQYNLDEKLEEVKSEIRKDEEAFKADIRDNEEQIAALRSGALSGLANRQAELDRRRLDALQKIWDASVILSKIKHLSKMSETINMDEMLEAAASGGGDAAAVRDFAKALCKDLNLESLKASIADPVRPFVPPMTWALFSAYRAVLLHPLFRFKIAETGANPKVLAKPDPVIDLVKTALPDFSEFLDEHGSAGLPHLVCMLEEKLLSEIRGNLSGSEEDARSVEKAAEIVKAAARVSEQLQPTPEIPNVMGIAK